jgi:Uma2 family endonuclease
MSTATSSKITHDDLLKMPEDNRLREIIDGELIVSPSPFVVHQRILRELARLIGNYLELYPLGELFVAPLDTVLAQDQVLQPDVLYVSKERAAIVGRWIFGAPDLAVEIISDSSRRRDEVRKRELYEQYGVAEYWIVDPEADHVTLYRRSGSKYGEGIVVRATLTTPLLPGLEIDLAKVFAPR